MDELNILWGPLRSLLKHNFSFSSIKDICGLAGLDLIKISHLKQSSTGGASKGQLMDALDDSFDSLSNSKKNRSLIILTEEILRRIPENEEILQEYLSRLEWYYKDKHFLPLEILDISELKELPTAAHSDLLEAAARLRDGKFSSAITSSCGAVDSLTSEIYLRKGLGDPSKASSFQEKVKKSFKATGVLDSLKQDLIRIGWADEEARTFCSNIEKSLNHAAYVMQNLRRMGDVHGLKPTLKILAFDSLKWAILILNLLNYS